MAANVHDVAPDAQHMVNASSADRVIPDTELVYTIDGLASWSIFVAMGLSPEIGDAFAAFSGCAGFQRVAMGIAVRSCSDDVLQDGILNFSSRACDADDVMSAAKVADPDFTEAAVPQSRQRPLQDTGIHGECTKRSLRDGGFLFRFQC